AVRSSDVTLEIMSHVEEGISYIQVHPTFLYESLWNTALLFLMLWLEPRKKFQGEVTCMYLCGYGVGRFFIEGLRTDQLLIPGIGLPVSQLLAFFMSIVFGLCILVFEWKFRKKKN
ncbi:prolipoprotein diacylglyceryl transferase, partial [bacterium 1XD42-8]